MNETTEVKPGTALTAPVPTDLQALFNAPDGIKAELARIKAKALDAAKGLDVSRKKDRDAMRSVAFAVAKRKTALDQAGKDLNEERRRLNAAVDEERRIVRAELDKLASDLRAPADKWEADEDARRRAITARLDASFSGPLPAGSADLIALRGVVDGIPLDASWAEFLTEAAAMKAARMELLANLIAAALEREANEAELAALRKAAAEREAADAERQRAADAAAARAKDAQDAAEAAQREAVAAQLRAEQEAADLRQQLAAEQAARAQRDADAAEKERQAKIDADLAEQAAKQAALDDAARAQAIADHKAEIRAAIVAALAAMAGRATPAAIADALINDEIPHCKVVL